MPRVPTLDAFSVQPSSAALPAFEAQAPGNASGEQMQRLGGAVSGLGNAAAALQLDALQQANQVRVDDAINQAKEAASRLTFDKDQGFTALKGKDAFERPDKQSLGQEYGTKLRSEFDRIEQGLGTTAQREAFRRAAQGVAVGFGSHVDKHEADQFTQYRISTREGTIANRLQEIGLNYNNPQVIDEAVQSIQAATYDLARLSGRSAEWAQAQTLKATSNAHKVAIATALERNDLAYANGYLAKYGKQMEMEDLLRVQGLITKETNLRVGEAAADEAVASAARKAQPTQMDRVVGITLADGPPDMARIAAITMQSESRGQRYGKDGKTLLTSPAGAKGEMQVLDGTNRDPGFGVRPAASDSPDERARVGRDYMAAMVKRYDGDLAKAWAAYNWGPGRVDTALKQYERERGQYRGADPGPDGWLAKAPAETQAYVAKNLKAYGENAGAPPKPTLMEVVAEAKRLAGPNPDAQRAAAQAAERKFSMLEKDTKAREDASVAEVARQLIANGGDWHSLPASVRNSIPPGQVDNMLDFGRKLSRKEPIETDYALFYTLRMTPDALAASNLMAFRHKLSDGDLKTLIDQQKALREGKGDMFTSVRPMRDVLNNMMRQAGINPSPKADDKKGAEKVGRILSDFELRLRDYEKTKGGKATTVEWQQIASEVFQSVDVVRMGGLWSSPTPRALVTPGDIVNVPEADRKQISDALKRAGREVTPASVEALYRKRLGLPPRAAQ